MPPARMLAAARELYARDRLAGPRLGGRVVKIGEGDIVNVGSPV
jgi:hypothetical protein